MPEENTAVAESPAEPQVLKDFGDLADVFNKVFPSTKAESDAQVPEPVAPSIEQAAVVQPTVAEPAAPAPPPSDDILPDAAFEEKPPVVIEKKEYEAPEGVKKDAKAYANWNELRHAEEAARTALTQKDAEIAVLRAKAESAVGDDVLTARLAELESVNKDLSDRISTVDLQSHPEFQKRFVQARDTVIDNAVSIAKDAGADPDALRRALDMHGKAKIEALDEIVEAIRSPSAQAQLASLVTQVNEIDRQRGLVLSNAKGNLLNLRKQDEAMRYQAMQDGVKKVGNIVTGLTKYFAEEHKNAFFREVEGNEKWNQSLKEDQEKVLELATKSTDESQVIGAMYLGMKFPRTYTALVATRKELQAARKELAELKGADPGLGGSRPGGSESAADSKLSFAESVALGSGLG